MKVGFNARHLSDCHVNGWNRYSVCLANALTAAGAQVILYGNKPFSTRHLKSLSEKCVVRIAPLLPDFAYEQIWLALQCRKDHLDVFHSPYNSGLPRFAGCATVLTIHDAIEERFNDIAAKRMRWSSMTSLRGARIYIVWRFDRARERIFQKLARTAASKIITASHHAKRDLVEIFKLSPEDIAVIYHAPELSFKHVQNADERSRIRAKFGLSQPYILYVGSFQERKNVSFLIRAFSLAKVTGVLLVLGGQLSHHGINHRLIEELGLKDKVKYLGHIDDDDLPVLYAEAACFVYPSVYEGFGLQLCEAMASGCPTLAADATSLPEVLGDGGRTFPLNDPQILGHLIRSLVSNPSFANRLRASALKRSHDFSWQRSAEATVAVYNDAIVSHSEHAIFSNSRGTIA
jgi:glycosyltransferase involved in cell wall biosynthesis